MADPDLFLFVSHVGEDRQAALDISRERALDQMGRTVDAERARRQGERHPRAWRAFGRRSVAIAPIAAVTVVALILMPALSGVLAAPVHRQATARPGGLMQPQLPAPAQPSASSLAPEPPRRLAVGSIVHSVAFSSDGRTLASGDDDTTAKLWDVASGRLLRTLIGHIGSVWSVAFSPDGRTLASGDYYGIIKLWDTASDRLLRTLTGHTAYVLSVAFSPDGRTLAAGAQDRTVKLWDAAALIGASR